MVKELNRVELATHNALSRARFLFQLKPGGTTRVNFQALSSQQRLVSLGRERFFVFLATENTEIKEVISFCSVLSVAKKGVENER